MKTAAAIIGSITGTAGLLITLFLLLAFTMSERIAFNLTETEKIFYSYLDVIVFKLCFSLALASILGIAGGALVVKKKTVSGVMFIAGAALNLISVTDIALLGLSGAASGSAFEYGLIYISGFVLLLLGGIFVLTPEKKPQS